MRAARPVCAMLRRTSRRATRPDNLNPSHFTKEKTHTMPKSKTVDAVVADGEQIARIWTENPSFAMSGVTLAQLQTMLAELRAQQAVTEDLRTRLTAAINATNERTTAITEIVTRARAGIRGFFGSDSTQYEQAGGTRRSERKTRSRKPPAEGKPQ